MLSKKVRKRLIEQNWDYVKTHDSNPSQTAKRIRDKANTLLRDLALLSNKMPDEMLQDVFTDRNIDGLILRLLKFNPPWIGMPIGRIRNLDSWRTQLSTSLVEKCICFLINQYELLEDETPAFVETNVKLLRQTIALCNEIASGVELRELKSKGTNTELSYLFNWNKIPGSDEKRLGSFMEEEIGIWDDPYKIKVNSKSQKELSCSLLFVNEDYGPGISIKITIEKEGGAVATFDVSDMKTKGYKKCNLKVVEERGQKYIYKENK